MFGAWPWACRIPILRRSIILPGLPFVREWLCGKFVVDLCCHQCWHSGFSAYNLFFLLYSCFLNYALWCVMQCSCHMCSAHHTTPHPFCVSFFLLLRLSWIGRNVHPLFIFVLGLLVQLFLCLPALPCLPCGSMDPCYMVLAFLHALAQSTSF